MRPKLKNLLVPILLISLSAFGGTDTTLAVKKQPWYQPYGLSIEYAGGFGMVSVGALYNWTKNSELGISVGYVPNHFGNIWTSNVLASYTILPVRLNSNCELHLFKAGVFFNFNYGKNIYVLWPDKYPKNYYWWNSSIRMGPFIDTELKLKPVKGKFSYTFFFQCLTNDLYLYTYLPNTRFIGFSDIIYFGAGIKIHAGSASFIRH
jgi:hypothetical protein